MLQWRPAAAFAVWLALALGVDAAPPSQGSAPLPGGGASKGKPNIIFILVSTPLEQRAPLLCVSERFRPDVFRGDGAPVAPTHLSRPRSRPGHPPCFPCFLGSGR